MKRNTARFGDKRTFAETFATVPRMTEGERWVMHRSIWANCDFVDNLTDKCWVYRTLNPSGYAVKWIAGATRSVCRFMLAHSQGCDMRDIPYWLEACHNEDLGRYSPICRHAPACCNPKHMHWGTTADNAKERKEARLNAGALKSWFQVNTSLMTLKAISDGAVDTGLMVLSTPSS